MKPEQQFYQWLKKKLPFDADCQRIEAVIDSGIPDVNVQCRGKHLWIEMKVYVGGRTLIRPAQNAWLHRRAQAGGVVMVLSKFNDGEYHVWIPPFVTIPHGKYLWITEKPTGIVHSGEQLINFLFT